VSDADKAIQRLAEQFSNMSEAFGEGFWSRLTETAGGPKSNTMGKGDVPKKAPSVGGSPPLDLYVTSDEVVIHAVLPGISSAQQASLSLTGPNEVILEAFIPPCLPEGMYLHRERFSGYCSRMVTLPVSVLSQASARYLDGILEIHLRRAEPGKGSGGIALLHLK
jgi:HSP20 family molecular chaperone IbpA